MTEREKQLAGKLYCHQDDEIGNAFMRCSKLVYEFNATAYDDEDSRQQIIRKLLNAKGSFHIERGFTCVFGTNITIGDNFYANYNVQMIAGSRTGICPAHPDWKQRLDRSGCNYLARCNYR